MMQQTKVKLIAGLFVAATIVGGAGLQVTHHLLQAQVVLAQPSAAPSARLGDGPIVTIPAIGDYDEMSLWWSADGHPLSEIPWTLKPARAITPQAGQARQFVLQAEGPAGVTDKPTIIGFSFDGQDGADNGITIEKSTVPNGDVVALLELFAADRATTTVRVKVATGSFARPPDEPLIWSREDGPSASGKSPSGGYVIGRPFLREGIMAVTVSYPTGEQVERRIRVQSKRKNQTWHTGDSSIALPQWASHSRRMFLTE